MKERLAFLALLVFAAAAAEAAPHRLPLTLSQGGTPITGITFNAPFGGPNPTQIPVDLTNSGGPPCAWAAASNKPWLTISPNASVGAGNPFKANETATLNVNVDVTMPPPNNLAVTPPAHVGTISFTNNQNSTVLTLTVTVNISSTAQITVSPSGPLTFDAPAGGSPPGAQILNVKNTGGTLLEWSASAPPSKSWIKLDGGSSVSGSLGPGASTNVSISVTMLGASDSGTINFIGTGPSSGATPRSVTVNFNINSFPLIGLSPTSMTFDAAENGADPPPKFLSVTNQGGQPMTWTATIPAAATWLQLSSTTGPLNPGQGTVLTVSVDVTPGGAPLVSQTYIAVVGFTGTNGTTNSPNFTVTLNVNAEPKIGLNQNSFSYSLSVDQGSSAPSALIVTNTGSGTLEWEAAGGASWLLVGTGGGSLAPLASQAVLLTANVAGLTPGVYTTTLQIQNRTSPPPAKLASNSPQAVGIDLTVTPPTKPVDAPAGQCGLMGLEALLPALWVLARRRLLKRGDAA